MEVPFIRKITSFEQKPSVRAIRSGLAMIVPILLLGSFCLVLQYFPIVQYQDFVNALWNGSFVSFLGLLYNATFGMMSVYLCVAVSYCYARQKQHSGGELCAPLTSLICMFICSGVIVNNWDALGVKGMFVAILSAIIGSKLYTTLYKHINKRRPYMESADTDLNAAIFMIFPAAVTCFIFALCNLALMRIFKVESLYELFTCVMNFMFQSFGRSVVSGILFVTLSSLLWFFGIHGSNVLESVMQELFTPSLQTNIDLVQAGLQPTEILTKQFFDVFVLMGGCGTAICLLLSIMLFSKRQNNRGLAKMALIPMLFNINEIMTFGFPVVFNLFMFVPFVCTPIVTFIISYLSMATGIVPVITAEVNWTIPVVLGGYMATGSVRGSILQIVNMIVGVMIYRPFVLEYDRRCEKEMFIIQQELVSTLQESERTRIPVLLSELPGQKGAMARALQEDIKYFLKQGEMPLHYQPQFDADWNYIGAEALLRWKHPVFGMLYPPLIIQLAKEGGMLEEMERKILRQAVVDSDRLQSTTGKRWKISVNVPAELLSESTYLDYLKKLMDEEKVHPGEICLEITEQTVMMEDEKTLTTFRDIHNMGYLLAIDDFSMGHTSLSYLQRNSFDLVKLDGNLVMSLEKNPRCADIIRTMVSLADNLHFAVIAEHVETTRQMELLEQLGCTLYQGFLVSPAVQLTELETMLSGKANAR